MKHDNKFWKQDTMFVAGVAFVIIVVPELLKVAFL